MDQTERLQAAVAGIMRALKVADGALLRSRTDLRLTPSDAQALQAVAADRGLHAGVLAQRLGVVPTTATSIVDRLVRRGLVRRERLETDRRAVSLTLTEAGRQAAARLTADEIAAARLMLSALRDDEREPVVDAIARIAAHMQAAVRPGGG